MVVDDGYGSLCRGNTGAYVPQVFFEQRREPQVVHSTQCAVLKPELAYSTIRAPASLYYLAREQWAARALQ